MTRLVIRANRRFLLRHPWQLILALMGIVVGVAVVVAMDLAKNSALVSFERATITLFGRATHRLSAPGGLGESLYRQVRRSVRLARPLVEGTIRTPSGKTLTLLGIEPLAEQAFAPGWMATSEKLNSKIWRRLLLEPVTVLMDARSMAELHLQPGDRFTVQIGDRHQVLNLIGGFPYRRDDGLVIADIATAQEVLDRLGRLSAIDLVIEDARQLQHLRQHLPPRVELSSHRATLVSAQRMTSAFYVNLAALSLLSLLVGAFLIFNTVRFVGVQRRQLFAVLRLLGLTRREVFLGVLGEAFVLGATGSLVGVAVGMQLARLLLKLLARTLNDVYFPLPTAELVLSPTTLAKGLALGLVVTLAAALLPALEASATRPITVIARSLQEARSRRRMGQLALLGLVFLVAGAVLLAAGEGLVPGFLALTAAVLGCALLTPALVPPAMAPCRWFGSWCFGPLGSMPPRSVCVSLSRTGVAAAALMVAVATTIGMNLMVHSFRDSVQRWLERRLDADLYVYASENGSPPPLPRSFGDRIAALPEVAAVGSVRYRKLVTEEGFLRINAYRLSPSTFATFELVERSFGDPWEAFRQGAVMVSEAFANLRGLHVGDRVVIPTPVGSRSFPITAVFVDYNAGRGIVAMSRETYDRFWNDDGVSTFWVYLRPDVDTGKVAARIRRLSPTRVLGISDNRVLLDLSMAVFDQAFAVTAVLRWLATGVAFIGVFSALLALQLERGRELGVLRALGLTPLQLWGQIIAETALLGGVAGLAAAPVGLLMGWLLMEVINRRAFGWTLELIPEPADVFQGFLLALGAAVLAGLYPAWKMTRTPPAEALRCE